MEMNEGLRFKQILALILLYMSFRKLMYCMREKNTKHYSGLFFMVIIILKTNKVSSWKVWIA